MIFGATTRAMVSQILTIVRAISLQGTKIMSSQEIIDKALADLKQSVTDDIASHKADAAALADLTAKLKAAVTGQDNTVDVASIAQQIDDQAQALKNAITSSAGAALNPQPAIAQTSNVTGGAATTGDVMSASSIQVSPSQATGGNAAPKDPGTPVPVVPTGTGTQVAPISTDPVATVMANVNGVSEDHVQAAVDAHQEATDNGASSDDAKKAATDAATDAGADPSSAAAIVAAIPPTA